MHADRGLNATHIGALTCGPFRDVYGLQTMGRRVLITGASGFIGRAVTTHLASRGYLVRAAARMPELVPSQSHNIETACLPDLTQPTDWTSLLTGVESVIHIAGMAHVNHPLEGEIDRVNRVATAELAGAAASTRSGAIYISSVAAQSGPASDHVLTEEDLATPENAYGRSKLAAESAVVEADVPYVILRPVLVCGAGASGNLAKLMRIVDLPIPLPIGALKNRRSLLSINNLAHAVRSVLENPATLGEIFLVADQDH